MSDNTTLYINSQFNRSLVTNGYESNTDFRMEVFASSMFLEGVPLGKVMMTDLSDWVASASERNPSRTKSSFIMK